MVMRKVVIGAAFAAIVSACSSASGEPAPPQPGALRARSVGGTDLGYAYTVAPYWLVAVPGGTNTVNVQMVLVKEQPAGAATPMLVWRALPSGAAYPCVRFYAEVGCTGARTIVPGQSGAACVDEGRMYRPDFTATAGSTVLGSSEQPRWDPATLSFVHECTSFAMTPPTTLPAIDAGPAAPPPGRIYIEAAD